MRPRHEPLALTLGFAPLVFLLGCPPAPEPEPEPEPEPVTETALHLTLTDRLTDVPVSGCEVGTALDSVVTSGADGVAELTVDVGSTVHVRCATGPVQSWQLPAIAEVTWTLEIDRAVGPDVAVWCSPTVHVDSSALGAGNGGRIELRVLNADQTAGFTTNFQPTLTLAGVFFLPQGDYKLFGRAYDGTQGGFGRSALLTCDGDGSAPEVDLVVEPVPLRELSGTWGPATGADAELFAHQQLDDPDFDWFDFTVAHRSSGNPVGWSLTVAEEIGAGPLDLEACQTIDDATACLNLLEIDDSDDVAVGDLPLPVTADVGRDDDVVWAELPLTLESGHMTVRLDDYTDPFDQAVLWRGHATESAMEIPRDWLDGGASGTDLRVRLFALDGATYDAATSPGVSSFTDGWLSYSPPLTPIVD